MTKTLKKLPISVIKLPNTRKCKNKTIKDQDMPVITEKHIEAIVEQKTNIPVGDLKEKEQSQLLSLADDLKSHVIGQDAAVDKIAKAIRS